MRLCIVFCLIGCATAFEFVARQTVRDPSGVQVTPSSINGLDGELLEIADDGQHMFVGRRTVAHGVGQGVPVNDTARPLLMVTEFPSFNSSIGQRTVKVVQTLTDADLGGFGSVGVVNIDTSLPGSVFLITSSGTCFSCKEVGNRIIWLDYSNGRLTFKSSISIAGIDIVDTFVGRTTSVVEPDFLFVGGGSYKETVEVSNTSRALFLKLTPGTGSFAIVESQGSLSYQAVCSVASAVEGLAVYGHTGHEAYFDSSGALQPRVDPSIATFQVSGSGTQSVLSVPIPSASSAPGIPTPPRIGCPLVHAQGPYIYYGLALGAAPVNNTFGQLGANLISFTLSRANFTSDTATEISTLATIYGRGVRLQRELFSGDFPTIEPCFTDTHVFIPTMHQSANGYSDMHAIDVFVLSDFNLTHISTAFPGEYFALTCTNATAYLLTRTGIVEVSDRTTLPAVTYSPASTYAVGASLSLQPSVTLPTLKRVSMNPFLPGVSVSSTGVISGSPTVTRASTTYTIVLTSEDDSTITVYTTFAIVAAAAPGPPSYDSAYTLFTGHSVSIAITADSNTDSYSISPSLPAGLIFDTTTGSITGFPAQSTAGFSGSFSVVASNTAGQSSADTFTLTLNNGLPAIMYSSPSVTYSKGVAVANNFVLSFGLMPTNFSISPHLPTGLSFDAITGNISGTPTVFFPKTAFIVTAFNVAGSTATAVTIEVLDSALVVPASISYATFSVTLEEATAVHLAASLAPTGVSASFSIAPSLPSGLSINATSGAIFGSPSTEASRQLYQIVASNSQGSVTTTLSLEVVSRVASSLSYQSTAYLFTLGSPASALSRQTNVLTALSSSPALPDGLFFSGQNISGTPTVVSANRSYVISGTNSQGAHISTTLFIAVNPAALGTLSYHPPSATVIINKAITPLQPSWTGGAPTSFSVSPTLPSGLSLNPQTGVVFGVPSAVAASKTYSFAAANQAGSISVNVDIAVVLAPPTSIKYPKSDYTFVVSTSVPVSDDVTPLIQGGSSSLTFSSVPSLPTGLTLNTSTGIISGQPVAPSSVQLYQIKAQNSGGSSSTSVSITIAPPTPTVFYPVAATLVNNSIANVAPTVSGSLTGWSFSISPVLPTGLSLNPATGVIAGTPTRTLSKTAFTVSFTSSGSVKTTPVTIEVIRAAIASVAYSNTPVTYYKNLPISPNIPVVTGGTSQLQFEAQTALPAGLVLDAPSGLISGTPTAEAAQQTYTISAFDDTGLKQTGISITVVNAPPTVLAYSLSQATFRRGLTITPVTPTVRDVSGAAAALTSCSTNPALPLGLSISSVGVISGTPQVPASMTSYEVTCSNSGGSAVSVISFQVAARARPICFYAPKVTFTVGQASTFVPTTSNITSDASFTVSPTLPPGLSLNDATGAISGTPATTLDQTIYTVVASDIASTTSTSFSLEVRSSSSAPNQVYATLTLRTTIGSSFQIPPPATQGGPVTSYAVYPPLPTGLSLHPDGSVRGTVSSSIPADPSGTVYTITITGPGGTQTVPLRIITTDPNADTGGEVAPSVVGAASSSDLDTVRSIAIVSCIIAFLCIVMMLYMLKRMRSMRDEYQQLAGVDTSTMTKVPEALAMNRSPSRNSLSGNSQYSTANTANRTKEITVPPPSSRTGSNPSSNPGSTLSSPRRPGAKSLRPHRPQREARLSNKANSEVQLLKLDRSSSRAGSSKYRVSIDKEDLDEEEKQPLRYASNNSLPDRKNSVGERDEPEPAFDAVVMNRRMKTTRDPSFDELQARAINDRLAGNVQRLGTNTTDNTRESTQDTGTSFKALQERAEEDRFVDDILRDAHQSEVQRKKINRRRSRSRNRRHEPVGEPGLPGADELEDHDDGTASPRGTNHLNNTNSTDASFQQIYEKNLQERDRQSRRGSIGSTKSSFETLREQAEDEELNASREEFDRE